MRKALRGAGVGAGRACLKLAELTMGSFSPHRRFVKKRGKTGKNFLPSPHISPPVAFPLLNSLDDLPSRSSPGLETAVLLTRINNFMME